MKWCWRKTKNCSTDGQPSLVDNLIIHRERSAQLIFDGNPIWWITSAKHSGETTAIMWWDVLTSSDCGFISMPSLMLETAQKFGIVIRDKTFNRERIFIIRGTFTWISPYNSMGQNGQVHWNDLSKAERRPHCLKIIFYFPISSQKGWKKNLYRVQLIQKRILQTKTSYIFSKIRYLLFHRNGSYT